MDRFRVNRPSVVEKRTRKNPPKWWPETTRAGSVGKQRRRYLLVFTPSLHRAETACARFVIGVLRFLHGHRFAQVTAHFAEKWLFPGISRVGTHKGGQDELRRFVRIVIDGISRVGRQRKRIHIKRSTKIQRSTDERMVRQKKKKRTLKITCPWARASAIRIRAYRQYQLNDAKYPDGERTRRLVAIGGRGGGARKIWQ